MKAIIALLTTCSLASGAAGEFREFTACDGRKLKAEVVSCDGARGRVEIRREDGRVRMVHMRAFSPEDQAYIRKWIPVSNFMSVMEFPVTVSKVEDRKWRRTHEGMSGGGAGGPGGSSSGSGGPGGGGGGGEGGGGPGGDEMSADVIATDRYERFHYDIKLANRGPIPLKELKVEYCIYYEQERAVPDTVGVSSSRRNTGPQSGGQSQEFYSAVMEMQVQSGSKCIPMLNPHDRRVLPSNAVTILNRNASGDGEGELIDLDADIKGVWVKVFMEAPDGSLRVREMAVPRHLPRHVEWKPVS